MRSANVFVWLVLCPVGATGYILPLIIVPAVNVRLRYFASTVTELVVMSAKFPGFSIQKDILV